MDNRFLYNDEELTSRLKILMSLAKGDDHLSLVIGEKGSGKTTLLKVFLDASRKNWRPCKIHFQADEASKKHAAAGNILGRKGILLDIGSPPILVIDDAHEIDAEGIQFLLRQTYKAGKDRKIRSIILFCEPSENGFVKTLSECIPNESAANTVYIKPLTHDQTARYLHQFSRHLGLSGKKRFSSSQINKIFDASRGLPGEIQHEARRMLDSTPLRKKAALFKKLFRISSTSPP